jgi:hypothetical protein
MLGKLHDSDLIKDVKTVNILKMIFHFAISCMREFKLVVLLNLGDSFTIIRPN